jgi:hypothetical protein
MDIIYSTVYNKDDLENLKTAELSNSYNKECIGVAKNYKIIAKKALF